MDLPQLPKEARHELPGATDKSKRYRGTFVWWVIVALVSAVGALGWALNASNKSRLADKDRQIKELTRERDEYKYYAIPALKEIEPQLKKVEQKVDTIQQQAAKNDDHFSKILNKAKDAVRN